MLTCQAAQAGLSVTEGDFQKKKIKRVGRCSSGDRPEVQSLPSKASGSKSRVCQALGSGRNREGHSICLSTQTPGSSVPHLLNPYPPGRKGLEKVMFPGGIWFPLWGGAEGAWHFERSLEGTKKGPRPKCFLQSPRAIMANFSELSMMQWPFVARVP